MVSRPPGKSGWTAGNSYPALIKLKPFRTSDGPEGFFLRAITGVQLLDCGYWMKLGRLCKVSG